MLTFNKLREVNKSRSDQWHSGKKWSLSDWGVAMAGEAGEVCDVIKKLNRIRDGINTQHHNREELISDLGKELADTLLYLDLLADAAGIDLEQVIIEKFNIVSEKYAFPHRL